MPVDVPAEPLDLPAASASLISGRLLLMGVAVGESTGLAVAKVRIRDGTKVAGTRLLPYTLTANESVREWFGPNGIVYEQGVYVELVSGAVEGSVLVIPESRIGHAAFAKLVSGVMEGVERQF